MKMARLLFALTVVIVGLMGVGSSLTAQYFSSRPPLSWGKKAFHKPQPRDRLIAFCISFAFLLYGAWLLLGIRLAGGTP
jgi:hypothetical protein